MGILSSPGAPFGPLEPVHQYILQNATPVNWYNWPWLLLVPLIPLGLVTYMIQFEGTRIWRLPLGVAGVGMILHAASHYRFDDIEFNAMNNFVGIASLHLIGKYVEFGLLSGPIVDPYVARGSRSRFLASIDIAINSRMIGLGLVDLNRDSKTSQRSGDAATNDLRQADGGVRRKDDVVPHHQERWLPYTNSPHRTRLSACWRHFRRMIVYYTVIDTLMALLWHFGSSTIANPHGAVNGVDAFLNTSRFVLLPSSLRVPVPTVVVVIIIELSIATAVWQGISMMYHLVALFAVGSGLWEVESWEVDIMDSPWKADSILNMWGRRWHQLFRHHFLLVSTIVLQTLGLPVTPPFLMPSIFFLSGAMHALGQLAMSPVPNPPRLGLFFLLSGIGCALEATFRKVTGRRVHGFWGRIWTWSYFLITGRWTATTWLDGGLGGNRLIPTDFTYRPGPILVRFATAYLFDTVGK